MSIFLHYWRWYYLVQPKSILEGWWNFLVFGINFFSIPLLLKTFFAPWHKFYVSYGRGFDLKVWAEALISNFIFRALGAIMRTVIILMGILFEFSVLIFGFVVFIGWLILPLCLLFVFLFALTLFFL